MERVVFLDRDGTLNEEVHYLHRTSDLKLLPGVPEALRMLKEAGYCLVVVTNQAGVARGYYGEEDVKNLHVYMNRILEAQGASIDAFYYCPHHPEHGTGPYKKECSCRKPGTGMFEMAGQRFAVDKSRSFMIGSSCCGSAGYEPVWRQDIITASPPYWWEPVMEAGYTAGKKRKAYLRFMIIMRRTL